MMPLPSVNISEESVSEIGSSGSPVDAVSEKPVVDVYLFESSQRLIHIGFYFALVLSTFGFISVIAFLSYYAHETVSAYNPSNVQALHALQNLSEEREILFTHMAVWRFALQACGVMAGVVFGFIGLALFLLGIKGNISGEGRFTKYSLQINHLAPGTFVILIAAVLVAVCTTYRVDIDERSQTTTQTVSGVGTTTERPRPTAVRTPETQPTAGEKGAPATAEIPLPPAGATKDVKR
jgi:hypothetical protein